MCNESPTDCRKMRKNTIEALSLGEKKGMV
jgi:hypothetical protein